MCLIFMYYPAASNPPDPNAVNEEALGCPKNWKKNGQKCYLFLPIEKKNDWNTSRKACTDRNSDLVIIDNKEELNYLISQSKSNYYLLGLRYSKSENKWKWINDVEHSKVK
ncbi:C-type lectin domain family 6 member A-like [Leptosomus discolor]